MFQIRWTKEASKKFRELEELALEVRRKRQKEKRKKSSKQEGLFKQVKKTIDLLANNPKHPSLQTHEYSTLVNPYRSSEKVFEAYAQNRTPGAYRVFWCYGPESQQITVLAITPHP
ncbi:hypothetical protein MRY87_13065 [bacterium]|nr:hypothetical protein [bacterium]